VLILRCAISPAYGQVHLSDTGCDEYPVWDLDDGEQTVITNDCTVAVLTRGEQEGEVSVEVRTDPPDHVIPLVFAGQIRFRSSDAHVGNGNVGEDEAHFRVDPGRTVITVYRDDMRSSVIFVLGRAEVPDES
jgi:hypothetical protein